MKIVYSLPNCPGCVTLKNQLKAKGEAFEERVIGEHLTLDQFKQWFPDVRGVPFVVEDVEDDQS